MWADSAAGASATPSTCDEKSKYRKRFCSSMRRRGKAKERRFTGGEQSRHWIKEEEAGQSVLNIMCCLRLTDWMSAEKSADVVDLKIS